MENLTIIGTVALIHILGAMSPGPDLVMAIKNSLTYSRRTGIWTAVGFGLGISVHIIYSLAGLAVVISQSILLFTVIKYLGAAYLIYIGVKSIFSKRSDIVIEQQVKKPNISPLAAVKMGFLTNVLNPKATLFFLSLFTLVISPETSAPVMGIISAIMIVNTTLWFSLVAVLFTQSKVRSAFDRYQNAFNRTFGGLLIALGVKVATVDK
jgi:RhtB (resistance to homoserine/threonine) family protein